MENKIEKKMSPTELADQLEAMARQLRDGQFKTHSGSWPVPEALTAKIKIVEKKGRLQTRLKFKWSTVEHYAPPEKAAVKEWEDRFKAAKKQLGRSFKALSRTAGQDTLPDRRTVDQYLSDSAEFESLSQEQWPEEMAVYRDHVQNMKRAVEDGRMADFQHEIRDIRSAMTACHQAFK
jgi:XXXCH domain-containing protein